MNKRLLDIILILLSAPITIPVLSIGILLVFLFLGRPIFFKQRRIGKGNKEFIILKLRTMKLGDAPDHERSTFIGNLLRKLSIDELPELFNIVKGQMSLVGPRPLPTRYLEYYTDEEIKRHDVLPGLTGLAQANGRNAISWKDKFKLDIEYVEKQSLLFDIKIIFKTAFTLFNFSKINASEKVTMLPLDQRLHIIGAGGHAKVIYELAEDLGYEIAAIYDSNSKNVGKKFFNHIIKHDSECKDNAYRILAIGSNSTREKLANPNHRYATLVHPHTHISKSATIGEGSVIFKGVQIQADVKIGKHSIINTKASIDHDCQIGDYTHIAPGSTLCGEVCVGDLTFICTGTNIIQQKKIGKNNIVAAGSTVTHNIDKDNSLFAGVPAVFKKDLG
ncbi:MAG: NeuD/PglB/VioB family sugar acetyltransferase [Bacteriovoracaceae bacterium]|jgi:sugar O-acyltransferase (sialic acid O-acetyltransferase NeuD family)|nr:NeuD/PglB/VioB family sugar acetyltransferase [Bacteriovoracaceae bacterium]